MIQRTGTYRVTSTSMKGCTVREFNSEREANVYFISLCENLIHFGGSEHGCNVEMDYVVSPATTEHMRSWPPAHKEVVR